MSGDRFAPLPEPPYYAVIFTNMISEDDFGYAAMADKMEEMAAQQPGFIGIESTRDAEGLGITVSYWKDEAALKAWKNVAEHLFAQEQGKARWYDHYITRVAKVERAYGGPAGRH
jgi:heme-degrading monooxygenase HmoA